MLSHILPPTTLSVQVEPRAVAIDMELERHERTCRRLSRGLGSSSEHAELRGVLHEAWRAAREHRLALRRFQRDDAPRIASAS